MARRTRTTRSTRSTGGRARGGRGDTNNALNYILPAAVVAGLAVFLWPYVANALPKQPGTDPNKPIDPNKPDNVTPPPPPPPPPPPVEARPVARPPEGELGYRMVATSSGNFRTAPTTLGSDVVQAFDTGAQIIVWGTERIAVNEGGRTWTFVKGSNPSGTVRGWVALERLDESPTPPVDVIFGPNGWGPGAQALRRFAARPQQFAPQFAARPAFPPAPQVYPARYPGPTFAPRAPGPMAFGRPPFGRFY